MRPHSGREIEHGARENRIGGTIGWKDETYGFEGFTNNQCHSVLGCLKEKVAVNGGRETGDDDGSDIFQWEFSLAFGSLAGQLPIPATQGAIGAIYTDNMIRHATCSVVQTSQFHADK